MAAPLPTGPGASIIPREISAVGVAVVPAAAPAKARSDAHLLELWLFGKSPHTRRAYQRVAGDFLAALGPGRLRAATLGDLQAWAGALPGQASSRAVTLAAVKSLLTFGHRVGYLPVNVGAALPLPKAKDDLAARILDREATFRLLDRAATPRTPRHLRLADLAHAGRDAGEIARFAGHRRPGLARCYVRLARERPGPAGPAGPATALRRWRIEQLDWMLFGAGRCPLPGLHLTPARRRCHHDHPGRPAGLQTSLDRYEELM